MFIEKSEFKYYSKNKKCLCLAIKVYKDFI